jgi:hypothetical protein
MKKYGLKIKGYIFTFIMMFMVISSSAVVFADSVNLAQGKNITASNYTQIYVAANAVDGSAKTYWEGAPNTYPNLLTVDLENPQTINKIVLKLNPAIIWAKRTQTLSVLTSTDGISYDTTVDSKTYTFDPANGGNSVTISFADTSARFVRLSITENTGGTAGQVAEFQIFGPDAASK